MSTMRASLVVTGDASGIVGELNKTVVQLDRTGAAAEKLGTSFSRMKPQTQSGTQAMIDGLTGVERKMSSARSSADVFSKAIDQQERSFKALRASLDPLYRAEQQFAAAQAEINRSVRIGAASSEEAADAMRRLEAQDESARQAAVALDAGTGRARAGVQNFAYQVGDVAVQVGAGTDAMRALGMQLPQMLGGMGMFGAVAGAAVAVALPLGAALVSMATNSASLEDRLDTLSSATDAYVDAAARAASAGASLRIEYRGLGDEIARVAQHQNAMAQAAAQAALLGAANTAGQQFGDTSFLTQQQPDWLTDTEWAAAQELAVEKLMGRTGASLEQVDALRMALRRLETANGPEAVVRDAENLQAVLVDIAGDVDAAQARFGDYMGALGSIISDAMRQIDAAKSDGQRVFEEMAIRGMARETELDQLIEGRSYAMQELANAQTTADAEAERSARAAIGAIDDQIRATTDAEGRVEALSGRYDDLKEAAGQVRFDPDSEFSRKAAEIRDLVDAARKNVDDLNDADLSRLEAAMRGLADIVEGLSEGAKGLTGGLSANAVRGYQQYAASRVAGGDAVQASRDIIIRFEGKANQGKWDENANRAGYGSSTVTLADGSVQKITAGMKINWADAERDLDRRITGYHAELVKLVGDDTYAGFTSQQIGAIASIQHNYGSIPGRIKPALQTGDAQLIAEAIAGLAMDYTRSERAAGKTAQPMNYNRRMAEAGYFGDVTAMGSRFSRSTPGGVAPRSRLISTLPSTTLSTSKSAGSNTRLSGANAA